MVLAVLPIAALTVAAINCTSRQAEAKMLQPPAKRTVTANKRGSLKTRQLDHLQS